MNERLMVWQEKIDALNQRERVLLLATAIVFVAMLVQLMLIDPVLAERSRAIKSVQELTRQVQQQSSAKQILTAQLAAGVNRKRLEQLEQLKTERALLDKKIQQSVAALISPTEMAEALEGVFAKSKGLRLLSLENKPVVALMSQDRPAQTGSANNQGLYNHGFVLRFSGSYFSVIDFFESLSRLPWRFYWDDMRYQVDSYPNATITLELHTVSMSEEWIGV